MSSVLVVGLGEVGVRAARQLLDTPGVDRVLVGARRGDHAQQTARALQDGAEPITIDADGALPTGVDVVACATPDPDAATVIAGARRAGAAVAAVAPLVRATGTTGSIPAAPVIAGCGLAPGLADVLARHAASALEGVDEVNVARWGVAGEACATAARRVLRDQAAEWRDGRLVSERGHGEELIWFPDPVGARECALVAEGLEEVVAAVPGVQRATTRLGAPPVRRFRAFGRVDRSEGFGAVRVEVWGWRDGARTAVVYGVIERTAVAAGTVLGVAGAWLAGAARTLGERPEAGVHALGAVAEPVPFLAEMARRGVKAAAFDGVPIG